MAKEAKPKPKMGSPILAKYRVVLKVRDRVVGGIPKRADLIEPWLAGRGVPPSAVPEMAEQVKEEVITEETERVWTTFKGNDEEGFFIEGRQIKAMLKDATRGAQASKKVPGLLSKIKHGMEITPARIVLSDKISGAEEKPISVITARGPRTSLKRFDFITQPRVVFDILVGSPDLTKDVLRFLLEYAEQFEGIGASVSQGEGKFDIETFEEVE